MYCIASRGQPTGCGPQAGGKLLTVKTYHVTKCSTESTCDCGDEQSGSIKCW
jgi:hypothetical protein